MEAASPAIGNSGVRRQQVIICRHRSARASVWCNGTAIQGIREGCGLAKRGHNEVRESLREMARIYQPKDARKFVREYIRKYRITGGYEDELTMIVEHELGKINSAS